MGCNIPSLTQSLNEKIDQRVRELYPSGLSGSEVAALITSETGYYVTRNSIISRWRKLKLPPRGNPTLVRRVRQEKLKPKKFKQYAPLIRPSRYVEPKIRTDLAEPKSKKLDIMDLHNKTCKYPTHFVNEKHVFCGHPTFEGHSFCEYHYSICYEPVEKR